MSTWLYYTRLAIRDLTRLWSTTQHHVIIVTGICLPILLLMGLKRGHVADLREELVSSPTGRQVVFWSAQAGEFLDAPAVRSLERELPSVDLIIPETQRLVTFSPAVGPPGSEREMQTAVPQGRKPTMVTLYPTRPGDPLLAQAGVDVLMPGEKSVVLASAVAESLQVRAGDVLRLTVERSRDGFQETASAEVLVKAAADFGSGKSAIGYADADFVALLEQYVRGYPVEELKWPAFAVPERDKYASYLLFCERRGDLTEGDRRLLSERGLVLEVIEDGPERHLYGLLAEETKDSICAYSLCSANSRTDPRRRLALAPSEIAELLESDCVVLPWNAPVILPGAEKRYLLIGLSMSERIWLRNYLTDPTVPFDYEADAFKGRISAEPAVPRLPSIGLRLSDRDQITIRLDEGQSAPLPASPVPAGNESDIQGRPSEAAPEVRESAAKSDADNDQTDANTKPPTTEPESPLLTENAHGDATSEEDDIPLQKQEPKAPSVNTNNAPEVPADDLDRALPAETPAEATGGQRETPSKASAGTPVNSSDAEELVQLFVPADLLAHIDAYQNGLAVYDPRINLFVGVPRPAVYDKARLYAHTIDEVPAVVDALAQRGFALMSEDSRIREIQQQSGSLELLVYIVGIGVFLFGVVTVFSVLLDSTDRKRNTIGILRVMGVSRKGIFYVVILRALAIGVMAALASVGLGYGVAWLLAWPAPQGTWLAAYKPSVSISLATLDILVIALGALLCSAIGALFPAWQASTMDPFDAVVEGRFR